METDPPGRLQLTGAHAGPLCLRPLNQNAVSHTVVPAASVLGNTTSTLVTRPVPPSNFQAPTSVSTPMCAPRAGACHRSAPGVPLVAG
jgi:hypothetical protein